MIGTILSIFGFGGNSANLIRNLVIGAILIAVGTTIYLGYRYVNNLQEEIATLTKDNATLTANNAQLEQSIIDQKNAIDRLERDIVLSAELQRETFDNFEQARERVRNLEDRLSRHELGFLASQRPGLVENIINDATEEVTRCFEIASGSPLTTSEINATLPSEINSECPSLANPNFIPEN